MQKVIGSTPIPPTILLRHDAFAHGFAGILAKQNVVPSKLNVKFLRSFSEVERKQWGEEEK